MQNKYLNIFFYSCIIVLMIMLSISCIFRYLADMNFDKARKLSTTHGRTETSMTSWEEIRKFKPYAMADIRYYYNKAVSYNILERKNYAQIINKFYIKEMFKQ